MRILLAGASGAIGRPLVPRLVAAGHEVVGLTRHEDRAREIDAAGGRGAVCDVLVRDQVRDIVKEVGPDVVMDQTTALPQHYDTSRMDLFYKDMVPLRLKGTPNLIEAAAGAGARIYFQSIAFLYAPNGSTDPKTEADPPFGVDAPRPWDAALPAITAVEDRVVEMGGVVLRYGQFYGPGTHFDSGQIAEDVKKRRFPVVGRGGGTFSFIHVDDAAEATVKAVEWQGSGILNIVDDEPVTIREWLPQLARELGARKPLWVPAFLAKRVAGPLPVHMATTMPGASNAKARRELGWAPSRPSVRAGFRS